MLHNHSIWKTMRKYTTRQIQDEGVKETSHFLENVIKDIIEGSEKLLQYNGNKNQRITKDCIKAVIKSEYNTALPERVGGKKRKKDEILQSSSVEVT